MVLDDLQIKEILTGNPNKNLVNAGRAMNKELTKYITGNGLKDSMKRLPYFQNAELAGIQKDICRTTRALFEELLQPTGKVFTAKGGVTNYNLGEADTKRFSRYINVVNNGTSMSDWVRQTAYKAYLIDPMGLDYTEIDANGNAYPTYKSTMDIYDYELTGRQPEYVVFLTTDNEFKTLIDRGLVSKDDKDKKNKLYRVVDDARDVYVLLKGQSIVLIDEISNFFGYVPGYILSDIPVFRSKMYESHCSPVLELAGEWFSDNSSKSLFKKYQMHLKEWGVRFDCNVCEGEGVMDGKACTACAGTGQKLNIKVAERIAIEVNDDGQPKVPIPPGGYIAPPTDSWNMMNDELYDLKQNMNNVFYGSHKLTKTTGPETSNTNIGNTATGEVYNERSKEGKLKEISKWAQEIHKRQTDNIKIVFFNNVSVPESTITYGDRYLLESPDELKKKYLELKAKQASYPVLDRALMDALEAEYANDPMEMRRQLILMRIEPYVHHTIEAVLNWPQLDDSIKKQKLYFNQWVSNTDPIEMYMSTEEQIQASFQKYLADQPGIVQPKLPAVA